MTATILPTTFTVTKLALPVAGLTFDPVGTSTRLTDHYYAQHNFPLGVRCNGYVRQYQLKLVP
jgi:hypothetical protein